MYCSRRLYKGNAYEICLPIADTGITVVRFYTRGDIIIEKEPETTGDSMCFTFTEEDLASLEDGVLRYGYDDFDTNSPYVVVTPGDYSGSTLDGLLEDAYDSGYTAGQEDCSGGTCEGIWESGYTSGYTDGVDSIQELTLRENITDNGEYAWAPLDGLYKEVYLNVNVPQTGHTDQEMQDSWDSGYTSGYTAGVNDCSGGTSEEDLIANLQGDYYVIPEGTTHLRKSAFFNTCFSSITIPDSVLEIGNEAFNKNTCLTSITIPDSVVTIGTMVFANCSNLATVTLGSGLTHLNMSMFSMDYRLTGITIPSTIVSLGQSVFSSCSGLTHITFEGTVPPSINTGNSLGSTAYTFPIYVPCESVEAYKTAFGQYYAPRITCSGSPEPVYSAMPLTFEIISGGTIGWDSPRGVEIEYSMDCGATWDVFSEDITVNDGDMVQFRGTGRTATGESSGSYSKFVTSGVVFNVCGNINSLLDKTNYEAIDDLTSYRQYTFARIFQNNTGLLSAENLKLPAMTMVGRCYLGMFKDCTNLTTAPVLPALTLVTGCYAGLYKNCSNLSSISAMFTDGWTAGPAGWQETSGWVEGVAQNGTFYKNRQAGWNYYGTDSVPSGWTIVKVNP